MRARVTYSDRRARIDGVEEHTTADGPSVGSATQRTASDRGLRRYVPILEWLLRYDRGLLTQDAVAGLNLWALMVPMAIAYAGLAEGLDKGGVDTDRRDQHRQGKCVNADACVQQQ